MAILRLITNFVPSKISPKKLIKPEEISYPYSHSEKVLIAKYVNEKLKGGESNEKANFLAQLNQGKPYQYVINEAWFYNLAYYVDEAVLIPRPETEEIVDYIIKHINKPSRIIDLGTGSGCIAIALQLYFNNAKVTAIDFSADALAVCKKNAMVHSSNIEIKEEDILNLKLNEKYDLMVSNPPYVAENEVLEDMVHLFEPAMALYAKGNDPLIFYKAIAAFAQTNLNEKGTVIVEINQKFGPETLALFNNFDAILKKDMSGNDRFIIAQKRMV